MNKKSLMIAAGAAAGAWAACQYQMSKIAPSEVTPASGVLKYRQLAAAGAAAGAILGAMVSK